MANDPAPTSEAPVTHEIGKRTYIVADVEPLDVDGVRTVAVGSIAWLVGFVGLLPFYGRLRDDGHLWWLWTCLAGFGLGLAGWDYARRRRRQRLERERADEPPTGRIDVPADPPLAPQRPQERPAVAARPPAPAVRRGGKPPFAPKKPPTS